MELEFELVVALKVACGVQGFFYMSDYRNAASSSAPFSLLDNLLTCTLSLGMTWGCLLAEPTKEMKEGLSLLVVHSTIVLDQV